MDSSAFNRGFPNLLPNWLIGLAGLGALTILAAVGCALWWVVSHLQWVW